MTLPQTIATVGDLASRRPYASSFPAMDNQVSMGLEIVSTIPLRCLSQTWLNQGFKAVKS